MPEIQAILFDKDGVLLDFEGTWGAWATLFLRELSQGDDALANQMGEAINFDLETGTFKPWSPVVAGTADVAINLIHPFVPHWDKAELQAYGDASAAKAPLVSPTDLTQLMPRLRAKGLQLGVATNDAESSARAHMKNLGVHDQFDAIFGYDSGHGAKPQPGMQLAFAAQIGVGPSKIAMIGDSEHDMSAGRAAGMICVGVLSGPAAESDLAPYADVVLPHIGHLPDWLDSQSNA